jgi:hypothetical protein
LNQASTSSRWLIFAAIAVFLAVLLLVQRYLKRKRTEALRGVALQLGLTYEGDDWLVSNRAPQLEVPLSDDRGRRLTRNIISGERDGLACSFFDFNLGGGRRSVGQTFATFTQEVSLPKFTVERHGILSNLGDTISHNTIHFDSHPAFSKRFRLISVDPERARELFTPGMLGFFESLPADAKWEVEGSGSTLLIYRLGATISPADYPAFIEDTTRMAKTFFSLSGLKKHFS